MALPAIVAVTVQLPALVLDSVYGVVALTEQPVAVPLAAVYVTAPPVEPPLVVNGSGVGYLPDVEVTVRAACVARSRWFSRIETVLDCRLVTARSGWKSPSKSATASADGAEPTGTSGTALKYPFPPPRRSTTALDAALVIARSAFPSPLKSPTATAVG